MSKHREERIVRSQSDGNLAWLDLEMTGLSPERDVILQAALIITNRKLETLEEYVCDIWQPEAMLDLMNPFVRKMHQDNGLIERVKKSMFDTLAVERRLLERISGWCAYPAILCGNTIGQDRRFIDRYMPGLAGYLNYRMIDVTALKLLAKLWYAETALFSKPTEGEHDALVDIRNSVAELKHYREKLFLPTPNG